jgi:hypothetical protein
MIGLAISILWLLIGVIILLGVVWLAIYVVKMFVAIPAPIEKAIWIVVLILCLIGALTLIAGGGGSLRLGRIGQVDRPCLPRGDNIFVCAVTDHGIMRELMQ